MNSCAPPDASTKGDGAASGSGRHLLIVGGGIIGLCSAYYAVRRGWRVTVLERGRPDHDSCSLGNAGMIVPSHFVPLAAPGMVGLGLRMMGHPESPFYVKPRLDWDLMRWGWLFVKAATREHVARSSPFLCDLHMHSRRAFVELAREHGNPFGLTERGLLMMCCEEHTLTEEKAAAEKARALGMAAEVLSPEETARLDPGAKLDIAGAVYYPQDCHLTPHRFLAMITDWLRNNGAEFHWQTEVTGWKQSRGRVDAIATDRGEYSADEYVVAGGAWSSAMGKSLSLKLPMQAGKGYSLTLTQPRQLPSICSILTEARVAVTPMGKTLRFGGTMEIAGLNAEINPRRVTGIIKSVCRYFPDFRPEDFAGIKPWCGLRPCSPDGLPYVGRSRRHQNLIIATGHAMMGLSLGPVTGQIVADLVSGKEPFLGLHLVDPNRYS